ncbi:FkbM family methyltransferase [Cerasicoccus frondis]|uniref:FkbM family methyltransferase n=1 Tax=Cerasicoccus frondis TaxID=490090 RepID=UPI0028529278|nr:FkbM family methyltransferase [Cerasicoccus frondis]
MDSSTCTNASAKTPDHYAQWGEDRLIWQFFQQKAEGVFLEVGANHPIRLSQTYLLEQKGWRGVLIEPQKHCYDLLVEKRPASQAFCCGAVGPDQVGEAYVKIPPAEMGGDVMSEVVTERHEDDGCRYEQISLRTINDVLAEAGIGEIDFVSIDIEGMEIPALEGFDLEKHRPKLLLIEDHLETLAKHRYLQGRGYRFIHRLGSNNWYAPVGFSDYVLADPISRTEYIRKFYLSMPFRKLRHTLKRLRGKA